MYERLCVNVKVDQGFSFLRSRTTFHTLPLYHLHTQNYTTLEIPATLTQTLYQLKLTTREKVVFSL